MADCPECLSCGRPCAETATYCPACLRIIIRHQRQHPAKPAPAPIAAPSLLTDGGDPPGRWDWDVACLEVQLDPSDVTKRRWLGLPVGTQDTSDQRARRTQASRSLDTIRPSDHKAIPADSGD